MIDGRVLQSAQRCFEKKSRVVVKMVVIAVGGNNDVCQESICHDYVDQEYKPSSALNIITWITKHVIKKHQEKSFHQVSPPLSLLSCLFVRI